MVDAHYRASLVHSAAYARTVLEISKLCIQVVKGFAREAASQVGGFSLGKFNVTLDYFCGRPIVTLVDGMRGNPAVIPPQKCSFP